MLRPPGSGEAEVAGLGVLEGRRALQMHWRRTALQNLPMGRFAYHPALRSPTRAGSGKETI